MSPGHSVPRQNVTGQNVTLGQSRTIYMNIIYNYIICPDSVSEGKVSPGHSVPGQNVTLRQCVTLDKVAQFRACT